MRPARLAIVLLMAFAETAAATNHCREVSEIVGRQRCQRFGDSWAVRNHPVKLEAGLVVRNFNITPVEEAGQVTFGGTTHTVTEDPANRSRTAVMGSMRATGRFGWFYLGGELEVGGIGRTQLADADSSPGTVTISRPTGSYLAMRPIAGLRVTLWRISLSAELAPGLVNIAYNSTARFDGKREELPISSWRGELESRSRVDVFVFPRLSVGIGLGRSLRDDNGYSLGLFVSGYERAKDR